MEKEDEDRVARWAEAHEAVGSEWLDDAACAGLDLNDFFKQYRPAAATVQVCAGCPVKWECLDDVSRYEAGHDNANIKGFFAGLTPAERRILYAKPRSTWPDEQIKQIKNYLLETKAIQQMPQELRDALFPNGGY